MSWDCSLCPCLGYSHERREQRVAWGEKAKLPPSHHGLGGDCMFFSAESLCPWRRSGDQLGRNTAPLSQARAAVKVWRRWSQNTCRAEVLTDPACCCVLSPFLLLTLGTRETAERVAMRVGLFHFLSSSWAQVPFSTEVSLEMRFVSCKGWVQAEVEPYCI